MPKRSDKRSGNDNVRDLRPGQVYGRRKGKGLSVGFLVEEDGTLVSRNADDTLSREKPKDDDGK